MSLNARLEPCNADIATRLDIGRKYLVRRSRGAGRFAIQGLFYGLHEHSGQGAAFRQIGKIKVLVVTAVNSDGTIVNRDGHVLRCPHPENGDCGSIADWMQGHLDYYASLANRAAADPKVSGMTTNTTLTVVVTNQALPFSALQRLAVQVHNSMARAIQPFGTEVDGDTLFAVTTGEVNDNSLVNIDLGALASETAWDAILASAPALPPVTPRSSANPSRDTLKALVGRYEFAPGVVARISLPDSGPELEVSGGDSMYLKSGQPVGLIAVAPDEFELAGERADRLRIDWDNPTIKVSAYAVTMSRDRRCAEMPVRSSPSGRRVLGTVRSTPSIRARFSRFSRCSRRRPPRTA